MSIDRQGKSPIENSEQEVQNWSFDKEFNVLASEGLSYNGTELRRNIHSDLKVKLYNDSSYDYICESAPSTTLSTAKWRITRVNKSTGDVDFANDGSFLNLATDLATVQGLFA